MSTKYKFEKKAIDAYTGKDFENAVYWYSRAISVSPDDAELYSERAVAYFHRKMLKESLADMDKAQEIEPKKPYRYSSRAYIKDAMGDTQGAVEDYRVAIELDPEDAVAHNNLGLLEEKLGHMAQAKAMFDLADALAKNESGSDDPADYRPKNIQREINQEKSQKSMSAEVLNIFRSKEGFKEFLSFIRNGFK
ncbi:tetratricopeptide repeat protein [Cryomorphaceae bacterium 1068]|nr:tetratricopeptide repeat protein [Cryomorphaceae bacterium 1068]